MNTIWETFITKHNGAYLARDAFDDFSYDILNRHYPGKEIISSNDYNNSNTEELSVVFLSKFFLDEFTNSRKGQIRKAFKKFIETKNKKHQKVYNWIFCAPYTLSGEELKWWVNWKNKATQKHSIEIEFFDGDHCIQLAKKYYLFDKWFLSNKEETDKNEEINNEILEKELFLEFITDNQKEDKNDKSNEEKKNISNEKDISDEEQISEEKESFEKQLSYAEKLPTEPKFYVYKNEYIRILEERNSLNEEQQEKIDKKNSHNRPFDYFLEINVDNIETISIFHKAKSAEVRNQFILALYYYEKYFEREDYTIILKQVRKKIPLSIKKCQNGTEIFLNELAGDIYYEKNEQNKALLCYKKAYKKNEKNNIISQKYFTLLGDNLINRKKYNKAISNYQKALNIEINKSIEDKLENAIYLQKAKKISNNKFLNFLTVFTAPFKYKKAYEKIPHKKTKKKFNLSLNKFYLTLTYSIIAITLLFVTIKLINIYSKIEPSQKEKRKISNIFVKKSKSEDNILISTGDYYMGKVSKKNIHLIDSAIIAYKKALKFNNTNKDADKKLKNAQNYKRNYIQTAQKNILTQKEKYFVSLRSESEGLQLFKYVYDQNNNLGKYGYVDTSMRIIIPPIYDFDYNTMYNGSENFHLGKALICLRLSNNDTIYMNINKKNKVVEIFHK